ncbi:MAG: DUF4933 domain-containing protein [Mariniphaga sp.]
MKLKAFKLNLPGICILMLCLFSSCGGNRLKNDEKALAKQILTEEEQLTHEAELREQREKQLADSLAKLPKGFRFKEIRSVIPDYPPVTIDFTKEIPVKKFNLSEIAKEIRYIRLSVPGDSLYFAPHMGGNVAFTDKNIILNNNFGVHSFSPEGEFLETIAQSNVINRIISPGAVFGYFDKESYKGVWLNHVSVAGDRIFYKVTDYANEKVSLLNYELKPEKQLVLPETTENKNDRSFFRGEQSATGKEGIYSGTPGLASTQVLGISSNFYAGVNSHLKASENGFMLATFNLNGDTLCKFTQFDKLEYPITSSTIRSINSIINWKYNGVFSFMKSFNDTIFRLVPPNRLIPVYVFKFGPDKITDEEWYQTNKEVKSRFLITYILENDQYLFLEFRHYDANGKFESYKAIYTKATHSLTQLPLTEIAITLSNSSPGLAPPARSSKPTINFQNDIDNGLPFWPEFIAPHGELGMLVLPERLKAHIEKSGNKTEIEKSRKLEKFAETLKSDVNERIIMLVK